jgi:hypothetical protein
MIERHVDHPEVIASKARPRRHLPPEDRGHKSKPGDNTD